LRFEQVDARFAQIHARFAQVDARFAQVDTRLDELEKRMNLSIAKQISDLRSQLTIQMMVQTMATVGAVSALVKLL
jgi:predicted transcriptional regulator